MRGSEGERSEPEGRAFWRKAQRNDRTVRGSEAAKRLKVVRFGEKSTVYSFRKISRPEHRNLLKEGFGAEIVKSILFAMKRQDWHGLLKN